MTDIEQPYLCVENKNTLNTKPSLFYMAKQGESRSHLPLTWDYDYQQLMCHSSSSPCPERLPHHFIPFLSFFFCVSLYPHNLLVFSPTAFSPSVTFLACLPFDQIFVFLKTKVWGFKKQNMPLNCFINEMFQTKWMFQTTNLKSFLWSSSNFFIVAAILSFSVLFDDVLQTLSNDTSWT